MHAGLRWALVLAALGVVTPSRAQPAPATAPADAIIEPTCADLMAAMRVADAGANPSAERRKAADEAQDDIATGLFWAHGWHVAKGTATLPVTRQWMVDELKRVVGVCRAHSPDGSMLISVAVTR